MMAEVLQNKKRPVRKAERPVDEGPPEGTVDTPEEVVVIPKREARYTPGLALDTNADIIVFKHSSGYDAKYEHLGECEQCGVRVFECITAPIRADELIGRQLVVYVKTSQNGPPALYCQAHDPTAKFRRVVVQGEYPSGDLWKPGSNF